MSEYQGCHKCKYGNKQPTDYPCLECEHNRAIDHYEPMTNADRIRNMTDEELAQYIYGVSEGIAECVECEEDCDFCTHTLCCHQHLQYTPHQPQERLLPR